MTPSALAAGGREARWTRDTVIEKIQEWVALYGEPPRSADWNPSSAKWAGATWRIARYEAGDWPSLNAAKKHFDGSFSDAIRAAGFQPNAPGPPSRRSAASPDLDLDRLEMHPLARVALEAARAEAKVAVERLERARVDVEALREQLVEARRSRPAARPAPRPRPEVRVKTVTKVVRERVTDTAAVERLRARLARAEGKAKDAETLARAERDRASTVLRELAKAERRISALSDALAAAQSDVRAEVGRREALEDRVTAAERVRVEVREVEVRSASDVEVEAAREAVRNAEVRVARAERGYRELAVVATGQDRRLTDAEVSELRKHGPSGPAVLAESIRQLTKARRGGNRTALYAALTKIAGAAVRWRDAL